MVRARMILDCLPTGGGSAMGILDQIEKGWPEDQIIDVDAAAVSMVSELRQLKESGIEFRWVQTHRVRDLTANGWQPVIEKRDGRSVLYMNRMPTSVRAAQDLVLVMRDTAEFAGGTASSPKDPGSISQTEPR